MLFLWCHFNIPRIKSLIIHLDHEQSQKRGTVRQYWETARRRPDPSHTAVSGNSAKQAQHERGIAQSNQLYRRLHEKPLIIA